MSEAMTVWILGACLGSFLTGFLTAWLLWGLLDFLEACWRAGRVRNG